jgi:alanine racemase
MDKILMIMKRQKYTNWLEIDLNSVEHNTLEVINRVGVPLMAVVKADAYGFGAIEIARTVLRGGASQLAVARVGEALALRQAGIIQPILVFGPASYAEIDHAIENQITLTLHDHEGLKLIKARTEVKSNQLEVHIKIDTGMGRLGVFPEDTAQLALAALNSDLIKIKGVYSHFAMIDSNPDHPLNTLQLSRFKNALFALKQVGIDPGQVHFSNSASALACADSRFNLVRMGSAFVGICPFYYEPFPSYLERVMTWKATLASCRQLPAGWGISYGQKIVLTEDTWVGVVPVGYADGYRRLPGNEVLIRGTRVPVLGNICADMLMVRLPGPIDVGEEIVLLGDQGAESIQIEDLATRWNTTQADVTASINKRIPRIYIS